MKREDKLQIGRILLTGVMFIVVLLLPLRDIARLLAFLLVYTLIGWDVVRKAAKNLIAKKPLGEHFLMTIATLGAFFLGEYPEAVAVMLFYQIGELFQDMAVDHAEQSIEKLMELRPDFVNLQNSDGSFSKVPPEQVPINAIFAVKAGERIPLDGVVISGTAELDTAALTGESMPRLVNPDDEVLSGMINRTGLLQIRATHSYEESTVSRILTLVKDAQQNKAKAETLIQKFAAIYTPIVVICAILLAVIPSLLTGNPTPWIYRALIFLVISCPCALVVSVPLSFFGGIGSAAKRGILIKGGNYLELLAHPKTVVFDKTGTLTEGRFAVIKQTPASGFEDTLLPYAAAAEQYSNHPVARALQKACKQPLQAYTPTNVSEHAGMGVIAEINGKSIAVGNRSFMESLSVTPLPPKDAKPDIYVSFDNVYAGCITIADRVKPDAKETIDALWQHGVKHIIMLSGDKTSTAENIGTQIGISEVYGNLLPEDKLQKLQEIRRGTTVFVGDGINDAPALALSDIGVAMGGMGSDAAMEAADIVLMQDKPSALIDAIRIAKKTTRIARENIVISLLVKLVVLILGALGIATMWSAVFADVGVTLIAVLNALRTFYIKKH